MVAEVPPNELKEVGEHLARVCGREWFDAARPIHVARAPGRLDVMGGFADYSGSLTLEMPIREAAWVAVQERADARLRVMSASFGANAAASSRSAEFPLDEIRSSTESYARAGEYLAGDAARAWTGYVLGAVVALRVERGIELERGLDIVVASSVPEGKGVSSSAAVEVASLSALAGLRGASFDAAEAAIICQRVENLVVGAPCGVMDQMTSSSGRAGKLLALLCQPAVLEDFVDVPAGLSLWGIDSGLRHQVSGADYRSVRVAAFMGYQIIAAARGLPTHLVAPGRVSVDDPIHRGYLANVSLEELRENARRLPDEMLGADFLREHRGITDAVTSVHPGVHYRVRAATEHPVHEHRRAHRFRELMRESARAGQLDAIGERMGELMYAAHSSYSACGLGSTGTDRLVELVKRVGPARGLYGAKITGGGSGGTVAILGRASAVSAVREIAARYAAETGRAPHVFAGSSPGAAAFGAATARFDGGAWKIQRAEPPAP